MKTVLASAAAVALWAAAAQPAAAMPLQSLALSNGDVAANATQVRYRHYRHYRHYPAYRAWGPRYVAPYQPYYSYGYYPYRYYSPGPFVRIGPLAFGFW